MNDTNCFHKLLHFLFTKEVYRENDSQIKQYKFCGLVFLKKEKTVYRKKTWFLGFHFCKTRLPRWKRVRKKHNQLVLTELLNDKRIVLDFDFVYKQLEGLPIESYEIRKIKLKDIKREWYDKTYLLEECSPYAYLNGDKQRYQKYVEENTHCSPFDMSQKRYDALIASLDKKGFDERKMPVINAINNVIIDGQHRCCWLLKKYGGDFELAALFLYLVRKKS